MKPSSSSNITYNVSYIGNIHDPDIGDDVVASDIAYVVGFLFPMHTACCLTRLADNRRTRVGKAVYLSSLLTIIKLISSFSCTASE